MQLTIIALLVISLSEWSFGEFLFHHGRHRDGFLGNKIWTKGPNYDKIKDDPHIKIEWFNQALDHFTPDRRMWKQKYWINDKYYQPGGPAFVLLGGEGPTSAHWISDSDGMPDWLKNAKTFGAMAFQLEHRFYGDSYPLENLSTENLKYLSSRQALADTADFIIGMSAKYNLSDAKWITFGGSYSGALSGWFREKYPHLVIGAMATSAPVEAQLDFKEYLGVVRDSLNSYDKGCVPGIQAATTFLEESLKDATKAKALKQTLSLCDDVDIQNQNDIMTLYANLAGNFMGAVQYNRDNRGIFANDWTIEKLCNIMLNSSNPNIQDRYGDVVRYINKLNNESCLDFKYDKLIKELQNTTNSPDAAGRLWTYQTCTEFGYFQSSDLQDQPFGNDIPLKYWTQQCVDIFGPNFNATWISKDIDETNVYYGGRQLKQTNIVLPNGSIDPWHALGILKSADPRRPAIYITGTAHCANMYPPRDSDLADLVKAREVITQYLATWLLNSD